MSIPFLFTLLFLSLSTTTFVAGGPSMGRVLTYNNDPTCTRASAVTTYVGATNGECVRIDTSYPSLNITDVSATFYCDANDMNPQFAMYVNNPTCNATKSSPLRYPYNNSTAQWSAAIASGVTLVSIRHSLAGVCAVADAADSFLPAGTGFELHCKDPFVSASMRSHQPHLSFLVVFLFAVTLTVWPQV
jgi:hypothetical protein